MIQKIEEADEALRYSGKCAAWFSRCDEITKSVSKDVNGFLLQELLSVSRHCDTAAADLFRDGAISALASCRDRCRRCLSWQVLLCWGNCLAAVWASLRR